MLTQNTRDQFETLLDAVTLKQNPDGADAIIYLETGHDPIFVSRAQFRDAVVAHAAGLWSMGIGPRDLVVIAHTQNLESIYAFWGAMLIGAIPSMFPTLTEKLDPDVYMNGMTELVRLSHVRVVLTTGNFAPILAKRLSCPVADSEQLANAISRNDSSTGAAAPGFEPHKPAPDDVAFLQHSSGTTGLQKGVALSHQSVLNQLASYGDAIALEQGDVIVSWLPLYHDMGLIAGFMMPLVQGVPLVLMSPFDWVQHPALLFRAIDAYQGTLCWLPNFAYNHCARRIRRRDTEGLSAATMRMFINCSEPVYHESHLLFLDRFAGQGVRPEMLAVSYAMAENTFGVTQTSPGRRPRVEWVNRLILEHDRLAEPVDPDHPQAVTKVSCGPPIDSTIIRVVSEKGQVLPERRVGELEIRSNCMLSGYYKRPDLEPFADGWYQTGDMGYLLDGEVYVVGRSKDLIINAGKNIYPQDIEAIINGVAGVHPGRAVAFGVPDEREGTELIAVVAEVKSDDPDERKEIGRAIRRTVTQSAMVTVSYVHLVDPKWLIKTSSGKIARAANRDKWLAEQVIKSR